MQLKALLSVFVLTLVLILAGCISQAPKSDKGHEQFSQPQPFQPAVDISKKEELPQTYQPPAAHEEGQKKNEFISDIPSCGANNVLFTKAPLKDSDYTGIVPLGLLAPPRHVFPTTHIYFHIARVNPSDYNSPKVEVPLYAMGDMWITKIRSYEGPSFWPSDPMAPLTDYKVTFSPCKEVEGYFIHVRTISDKLKNSFKKPFDRCDTPTTNQTTSTICEKIVSIKVSAGEQIGTAGGLYENALDMGMYDFRTPNLKYANPPRWTNEELHVVCPLDYFVPEIQKSMKARLGTGGGETKRTVEPVCGEVNQDISGTAQGSWLLKGSTFTRPDDPHAALVHDNVNPAKAVFSMGASMGKSGLEGSGYAFSPESSGLVNLDFKYVRADGKIYCYETQNQRIYQNSPITVIILHLTSPTTLRMEKLSSSSCGAGPWSFSDKYTEFER